MVHGKESFRLTRFGFPGVGAEEGLSPRAP